MLIFDITFRSWKREKNEKIFPQKKVEEREKKLKEFDAC
jgi:hypothetical protein